MQIEDIHADVNVKLKKLVIKLDEYDKEEEKQEEIKIEPQESEVKTIVGSDRQLLNDIYVMVKRLYGRQDAIDVKIDELYRHRLDR